MFAKLTWRMVQDVQNRTGSLLVWFQYAIQNTEGKRGRERVRKRGERREGEERERPGRLLEVERGLRMTVVCGRAWTKTRKRERESQLWPIVAAKRPKGLPKGPPPPRGWNWDKTSLFPSRNHDDFFFSPLYKEASNWLHLSEASKLVASLIVERRKKKIMKSQWK